MKKTEKPVVTNKDALWKLFLKTGLPEAYMMYKAEERRIDGGDKD